MGSIRFSQRPESRRYGGEVGAVQFHDTDGVPVLATLVVDDQNQLYELDVWKVDFSPLRQIPTASEFTIPDFARPSP